MRLKLEPIRKDDSDRFENVLVRDKAGYPWAVLFRDAFADREISKAIERGETFEVEVTYVDED